MNGSATGLGRANEELDALLVNLEDVAANGDDGRGADLAVPYFHPVTIDLVGRARMQGEGVPRVPVHRPAATRPLDPLIGEIGGKCFINSDRFWCFVSHNHHRSTKC